MDHLCEVIPRGEHFPRPVHIAYALDKALFRHPVQDGIEDILAFILASGMFFQPVNNSVFEKLIPGPMAV